MAELALVLTDFTADAISAAAASERRAELPRLPALETLLARSQSEPLPQGWRAWVAHRFGWPERAPSAALAAAAFCEQPASEPPALRSHHWFATPLNFFAGLDSVHLHPAGLLELSASEQRVLVADFTRVFAGTPWALRAIGQRELLLTGPALHANAVEPEELFTRAPDVCMARGADAPMLRRLASEIELWLHEHPLNLERARRGALPVTALWLWGGAEPQAMIAAATRSPPRLYGADSFAAALCRLRGESALPLPARLDALPALLAPGAGAQAHRDAREALVLLALTPAMLERGLAAALSDLEQHWFGGALHAVRTRRIRALHCVLGARAYRLTWRHCMRVWRRRPPWWEGLS